MIPPVWTLKSTFSHIVDLMMIWVFSPSYPPKISDIWNLVLKINRNYTDMCTHDKHDLCYFSAIVQRDCSPQFSQEHIVFSSFNLNIVCVHHYFVLTSQCSWKLWTTKVFFFDKNVCTLCFFVVNTCDYCYDDTVCVNEWFKTRKKTRLSVWLAVIFWKKQEEE